METGLPCAGRPVCCELFGVEGSETGSSVEFCGAAWALPEVEDEEFERQLEAVPSKKGMNTIAHRGKRQ